MVRRRYKDSERAWYGKLSNADSVGELRSVARPDTYPIWLVRRNGIPAEARL